MNFNLNSKTSTLAAMLALLLFSFCTAAQSGALSYGQGFVIKRNRDLGNPQDIRTHYLSVDVAWPTAVPAFKNPDLGLTLHYLNYSSKGIGNSLALFGFAEKKLPFGQSPLATIIHFGIGPIWVQEVFDIETNRSAQTVSTQLNFGADFRVGLSYQLTEKSHLETGLNFFHASNMGMLKPNYGINVPGAYLRYNYNFKTVDPIKWSPKDNREAPEWLVYYNLGFRQIIYNDPVYFVQNFNIEYSYPISPLFKLGLGASVFQEGIANELEQYDKHYNFGPYQPFSFEQVSAGPYFGIELMVKQISAFTQVGFYALHPHRKALQREDVSQRLQDYIDYYNPIFVFNRLGLRYRAGENWLFSFAGKTQLAKVQYMEFGIGYRF